MTNAMEHSPADVLRNLFIQLGIVTTPGGGKAWPAYVAKEPDTPDNVVTFYNTGGRVGRRDSILKERDESPGVQIRVRSNNSDVGYSKAHEILVALDETIALNSVSIAATTGTDTARYLVYTTIRTSGVLSLGVEQPKSKRSLFTLNTLVYLHQES